MTQQEPTPIVPPQEPLKGRDPSLAPRTMGEVITRPDGSMVNHVVLPQPLVGFYETERIAGVTLNGPLTVSEADSQAFRNTLAALFSYPDGDHEIVDHLGDTRRVTVSARTIAHLNVGLDNEDSPVTHLTTLLERLQGTHDEIRATANVSEPRVLEALEEAGLVQETDFGKLQLGSGEVSAAVAPTVFVWRK